MAQINIASYGRKYKNLLDTSGVRSPIRRIASPITSPITKPITKQAIYESVKDPMSMLPDIYNYTGGDGGDKSGSLDAGYDPSETQQAADRIMSDFMGYDAVGMGKKAVSLGWNAITSPVTMGVPFAEDVLSETLGAINTRQNSLALNDIMTENEDISPEIGRSALNSIRGTTVSDDLATIGIEAMGDEGRKSAQQLSSLSEKAAFDKSHPVLGFAKHNVTDPIWSAVKNVFGEATPGTTNQTPSVDFSSAENKGMGVNSGFANPRGVVGSSAASTNSMDDGHMDAGVADAIGSDAGKIVCSAMNELYGFGHERNIAWLRYSKYRLKPEHAIGYHFLFKPLVKIGFKSGNRWYHLIVRKTLEHIATRRTDDLSAEMNKTKRDLIGRIERAILEPICFWAGRLLDKKECHK